MSCRELLIAGLVVFLLLMPVGQQACAANNDPPADQNATKPAVSSFNGKLDYLGGTLDARVAHFVEGSFALPLGHSFGFQADAVGGSARGGTVKGAGTHVFWRDPDLGLVGATASRFGFDSVFGNRFGAEAEAYLGPVTVAVTGGWQNGKVQHTGWGGADLRYYPLDDVMLAGGWGIYGTEHTGHVGIEWRPAVTEVVPGLTLFGDAGFGGQHDGHVLGGVRIYFGSGDKSLKRRHREDDPGSALMAAITQALRPSETMPAAAPAIPAPSNTNAGTAEPASTTGTVVSPPAIPAPSSSPAPSPASPAPSPGCSPNCK